MLFIENVAAVDVEYGRHHDAGPNSMLIQIVDPCGWFPEPKYKFKEVHQFRFLDAEEDDAFYRDCDEVKVTDEDAAELVRLLQHAKANEMNVVVHCVAGICRSGAVVEVGVMLGFTDPERFRSPNLMVKHKMMKVLGMTYDAEEEKKMRPDMEKWFDQEGAVEIDKYYSDVNWYDFSPNWEKGLHKDE